MCQVLTTIAAAAVVCSIAHIREGLIGSSSVLVMLALVELQNPPFRWQTCCGLMSLW